MTGGTVENTANGAAILGSAATVTISGGTVSATTGWAVFGGTGGKVNITGGTVSATSGIAVRAGYGRTTVSGTAKITSANTNTLEGTIFLKYDLTENHSGDPLIEITGGTVENTSTTTGNAVRSDINYNPISISITGGTVSKAGNGNYAVYNGGTGKVTIGPKATIEGNNYGVD
jgi:hypothetical protein